MELIVEEALLELRDEAGETIFTGLAAVKVMFRPVMSPDGISSS